MIVENLMLHNYPMELIVDEDNDRDSGNDIRIRLLFVDFSMFQRTNIDEDPVLLLIIRFLSKIIA